MILKWKENLGADEMPPRWMWHLDWDLEIHFVQVNAMRSSKMGGSPQYENAHIPQTGNDFFDD